MAALEAMEIATSPAAEERDELLAAAGRGAERLVELAGAELRLIAISGFAMLLLVILTAAALIVAWGLAVAGALHAGTSFGLPWGLAALVLALGHVLLAAFCWQRMRRLSRHMTMPALRGALVTTQERSDV